jgi:hypothetical protein
MSIIKNNNTSISCIQTTEINNTSIALIGPKHNPESKVVLMMHFNDGWTIIEQFKFFKKINNTIQLIFTNTGMTIVAKNIKTSLVSISQFSNSCIIDNFFDPLGCNTKRSICYDSNGNIDEEKSITEDSMIIEVELKMLISVFKKSSKTSRVKLIMYEDIPDLLFVDLSGGKSTGTKMIKVTPNPEIVRYKICDQYFTNLTVKVDTSEVSDVFSEISGPENGHAIFRSFRKGIQIISINYTGTSSADYNWGECKFEMRNGKKRRPKETKINIKEIKIMSSIKNFNTRGVVSIFGEVGIIKLETIISTFGRNTTYMLDVDGSSVEEEEKK